MALDLFTYLEEIENEEKKIKVKPKKKPIITEPKVQKTKQEENKILSVFDLTKKIKQAIEKSLSFVWVEGEISNHKRHSSGHHYFSLKDEKSVISCVMWRGTANNLNFKLDNGQKVKIYGKITLYESSGRYQLDAKKIEMSGIGNLQLQFDQLKRKLDQEGLFSNIHKKKIPFFIKNIAVITAETGAAFQDIIKVIRNRAPFVNIYIYNTRVQGETAAKEISIALDTINRLYSDKIELIIPGRGGGSLEDLWPFNEEIVARSIFDSKIPIISAVGHEIDFSISDFVSDLRAATPSHAAEIATISLNEQKQTVNHLENRLNTAVKRFIQLNTDKIKRYENSYAFQKPADLIKNYTLYLDNTEDKLFMSFNQRIKDERNKLNSLENLLSAIGPDSVLNRGYAIISKEDIIIDSVNKIKKDDMIKIKMKDGEVDAVAE